MDREVVNAGRVEGISSKFCSVTTYCIFAIAQYFWVVLNCHITFVPMRGAST